MAALLLDFGGVVHRSYLELVPEWARREGIPAEGANRSGPFGTSLDPLWEALQRGEVTERDFWRRRAAEFGEIFGQRWSTRDLMQRVSDVAEEVLVRPEVYRLLDAAASAGAPTGVLTNDLEHFHGADWVARQGVLHRFDRVLDGSVTGVLKPDPQAYRSAAAELDVAVSDLVFLDDQPWNVAGAARLGARAIQVDVTDPQPAFDAAAVAINGSRARRGEAG
ncbi:putative hydrolase of the HAD superfamily [Haloechinothrix alba]|uniref:Putative hydrolase of the HAD superfamily n=1 Tax=Haloechinothrix alba TaxID=664784 RepID=A0A238X3L2_9PSEU|nr:HAD-IA family hydrolase [Haloechinothrix alba]SNR53163.1 putative hydrolase of the HAD superfamily [Haloechinothrix alba]